MPILTSFQSLSVYSIKLKQSHSTISIIWFKIDTCMIPTDLDVYFSSISVVNLKWRFQKNNDNGQVVSYVEDTKNKWFCYVRAAKLIRARAIKYGVPTAMPVAIFKEKKTKPKFKHIDDVHIKDILQEAAKHVYNISNKEDLNKFTSHSIRVMACVILHSQNLSTEDIKFRLRWRSDSFRMYLRNIVEIAERHKNAIANLS